MRIWNRYSIKLPERNASGDNTCSLLPGKSIVLPFFLRHHSYPMRRRLRVVGEVGIYWGWRDEGDEARIDIQSAEPGNIRIYEKDGSSLPTRLRLARAGAQSVSVELARKHHRR